MTTPTMSKTDTTAGRFRSMFHAALGPVVLGALGDPKVVEVMVNADGKVWLDRAGAGRACVGAVEASRVESVIRLVADHVGEEVGRHRPVISGTLPETGERFQGQLPPITVAPTFSIRKRAELVFTLDDYVKEFILTEAQATHLRDAVATRQNVLIAGGTGSGKTLSLIHI